MRYKFTKEQLQIVIKNSLSIAQVCRELGIRPVGGNYKTLNNKIKLFDIDVSHFTGKAWNVGENFRPFGKKTKLNDVLVENSTYLSTNHLKNRLFDEGLKQRVCDNCGISEWLGKPISLELEHINGNNTDNRLDNLKILCPNCHSQTPTFRRKNKLSALSEKKGVEYRKFREGLTANPEPSPSNGEGAETRHDTPKSKDMVKV